jgi:hypothetical protein
MVSAEGLALVDLSNPDFQETFFELADGAKNFTDRHTK